MKNYERKTVVQFFGWSGGVAGFLCLERIRDEMLVFAGRRGRPVLEISHRSKEFDAVLQTAKADLRELLAIPDAFEILFLQGGSRLQFTMIPQNLLQGDATAE